MLEFQLSWLERKIVNLEVMGSIPINSEEAFKYLKASVVPSWMGLKKGIPDTVRNDRVLLAIRFQRPDCQKDLSGYIVY